MTTYYFQKTGLHFLLKNYFFFAKELIAEKSGKTLINNTLNNSTSGNNADKNTDYEAYRDVYLTATRWQNPEGAKNGSSQS